MTDLATKPRTTADVQRDANLLSALVRLDDAEHDALSRLMAAFPKGRPVKWTHGDHTRKGVVYESPRRIWSMAHANIIVRSDASGKVYRVSAKDVIRTTIGEWGDD